MNTLSKLAQKARDNISSANNAVRRAFRGQLTVINSSEPVQRAQVAGLADETLQNIEHLQQFGFTSNPPAGSEAIVLPLGGTTSHSVIVATEHASYRIKALKSGEVAIYSQSGASITLKDNKIIEIDCDKLNIKAAQSVDIDTPQVTCSQQLIANGQISGNSGLSVQGGGGAVFSGNMSQTNGGYTTTGDVVAQGKSLTGHTHTGDSGGTTSPPL
ncbi:phage baseplate assembly protein V [Neisseriaceae bacterium ESL0693]|nr:phage baseplate assembly protein V [Neisseriaceae bacterium ESL0693]